MEYQHIQIDPQDMKRTQADVERLLLDILVKLQAIDFLVQEWKTRLPVIDLDE